MASSKPPNLFVIAVIMSLAQHACGNVLTNTLWFPKPAEKWIEALPVGNGRLGAMDYGGVAHERLQVNEDTIWAGGPYTADNPAAFVAYAKARNLIFAGNQSAADDVLKVDGLGKPSRQTSYQTLGEVVLDMPGVDSATDYRRSLDLDTAIVTTTYSVGSTTFTRKLFASAADQVLVCRLTANHPHAISFAASYSTPQKSVKVSSRQSDLLLTGTGARSGDTPGQIKFESIVRAVTEGGTIKSEGETLSVADADAVTLLVACRTNFVNYHDLTGDAAARVKSDLDALIAKSFEQLVAAHEHSYQPLFNRVTIDLGITDEAELPTDERIKQFAAGHDPALAALEYQYGRYLLISCSRPGGQPANLQGLWNESMSPPWNSKYTVNINTEMNYWPAEKANLAECTEPLFNLIQDVAVTGARTAEVMYHAHGWVLHHNTDLWRATAPIDFANVGIWPVGGAWLLTHVWEHYLYTGDRKTLETFYPIFKGSCEFFLDTLVRRAHPSLVGDLPICVAGARRRGGRADDG